MTNSASAVEKIQFWEGSMKDNCAFPETVEYKSCTATIYHQQHRSGKRFEVRYYDVDGSRQRLTFPTHSSARKFAETAVKEIAANREHFVTLRGREAFDYQTALETLAPLGLSMAQAATLISEHQRQLGNRCSMQEAIKYFLENRPQRSPDITVREVVDQMLALKEKEGEVDRIYCATCGCGSINSPRHSGARSAKLLPRTCAIMCSTAMSAIAPGTIYGPLIIRKFVFHSFMRR